LTGVLLKPAVPTAQKAVWNLCTYLVFKDHAWFAE
jgi:hypothetical protein